MLRTHAVTSKDSTKIVCKVEGRGPPLVLVHGCASVAERWTEVQPILSEHFTLYAMDRRGRGASGDNDSYSIEREFEDVASVVASIEGPVDLLGHSFGGVCSMEAALQVDNLRRLIVYEPSTPTPGVVHYPAGFVNKLQEFLEKGQREEVLLSFMREVVKMPPAVVSLIQLQPSWFNRVSAAHTLPRECRDLEKYRPDPNRFEALKAPTLFLLGGESPPRFRTAVSLMAEMISDNRVEILPGQQHNAMDTAPGLFAETVINFLRESK